MRHARRRGDAADVPATSTRRARLLEARGGTERGLGRAIVDVEARPSRRFDVQCASVVCDRARHRVWTDTGATTARTVASEKRGCSEGWNGERGWF